MFSTSLIELNKTEKYRTVDGRQVRFIARDAKIGGGDYDLVALITEPDGNEFIEWYKSSGAFVEGYKWVIPCDADQSRAIRFS